MAYAPLVARFIDNGERIELPEQDPSEWTKEFEKLTGGVVTQDGVIYTLTVGDVARTFTITGNERSVIRNSPK
jgi:predicted RNA polymerase sigma factor